MATILENFAQDTSANRAKNLAEIDKILLADDETKLKRLRRLAGEEGLDAGALARRQKLLSRIVDLERAATMPAELSGQIASAYQAASSFFDETQRLMFDREDEHRRLMSVGQSLQFQRDAITRAAAQLADLRRQLSGVPLVAPEPGQLTTTIGQEWIDAQAEHEKAIRAEESSHTAPVHSIPQMGFFAPGTQLFYADAKSPEHAKELHSAFLTRSKRSPTLPEAAAGERVEARAGSVQAGEDPPTMAELLAGDDAE